jgi:hypothetical protein
MPQMGQSHLPNRHLSPPLSQRDPLWSRPSQPAAESDFRSLPASPALPQRLGGPIVHVMAVAVARWGTRLALQCIEVPTELGPVVAQQRPGLCSVRSCCERLSPSGLPGLLVEKGLSDAVELLIE